MSFAASFGPSADAVASCFKIFINPANAAGYAYGNRDSSVAGFICRCMPRISIVAVAGSMHTGAVAVEAQLVMVLDGDSGVVCANASRFPAVGLPLPGCVVGPCDVADECALLA